jgi:hypothetical protein
MRVAAAAPLRLTATTHNRRERYRARRAVFAAAQPMSAGLRYHTRHCDRGICPQPGALSTDRYAVGECAALPHAAPGREQRPVRESLLTPPRSGPPPGRRLWSSVPLTFGCPNAPTVNRRVRQRRRRPGQLPGRAQHVLYLTLLPHQHHALTPAARPVDAPAWPARPDSPDAPARAGPTHRSRRRNPAARPRGRQPNRSSPDPLWWCRASATPAGSATRRGRRPRPTAAASAASRARTPAPARAESARAAPPGGRPSASARIEGNAADGTAPPPARRETRSRDLRTRSQVGRAAPGHMS